MSELPNVKVTLKRVVFKKKKRRLFQQDMTSTGVYETCFIVLDFSLCYININAMKQTLKYNENKSSKLVAKILFNINKYIKMYMVD